jgi:hypothetical protein
MMERILISDAPLAGDAADDDLTVQAWRAEQLCQLGFPRTLAEEFADRVDWHDVAALVRRGCPPDLALEIVR